MGIGRFKVLNLQAFLSVPTSDTPSTPGEFQGFSEHSLGWYQSAGLSSPIYGTEAVSQQQASSLIPAPAILSKGPVLGPKAH